MSVLNIIILLAAMLVLGYLISMIPMFKKYRVVRIFSYIISIVPSFAGTTFLLVSFATYEQVVGDFGVSFQSVIMQMAMMCFYIGTVFNPSNKKDNNKTFRYVIAALAVIGGLVQMLYIKGLPEYQMLFGLRIIVLLAFAAALVLPKRTYRDIEYQESS